MTRPASHFAASLAFAFASLILAFEPVRWLVGSWRDPSYASSSLPYLVAVAGLLAWSLSSPVDCHRGSGRQVAVLLLAVAALARLASQVLAVNVIGGLALALDVFALAVLLGTGERKRAVSPFWLSVLFLFTLPVERIAQRLIGYPLQEVSAKLACGGLGLLFSDLSCSGIRIALAGRDVLVDLPCSGTSGLMLSLALVVVLFARYRPRFPVAVFWTGVALVLSLLGNGLRIGLLATGIAYPELVFGADVMVSPLHDVVGCLALGLSFGPVLLFFRCRRPAKLSGSRKPTLRPLPAGARNLSALVFLAAAVVIVNMPRHALDVSAASRLRPLPLSLDGEIGVDEALLPVEERYFRRYGGHAGKRRYGPLALTVVHTSSPLRHLHAPDDCLRGLGYEVTFLGTRFDPVPAALYRARSPEGGDWRVAVTFVSDTGQTTHNIAEAIWLWLKRPAIAWTSIQQITPLTLEEGRRAALEAAVHAALDLTSPKPEPEGNAS
jgi:exosortase/archaeosortase family protein